MIQIACSTRCFPLETPARALSRVAWAGFRAAEVVMPAGEEPAHEAVGERLDAEDLSLVCIDAGAVCSASPEEAMEAVAHVGRCAVAAARLGAARVLFTTEPEGDLDHLAYGLSRLLVALGEVPVAICVLPQPGAAVSSVEALTDLCRAVDRGVESGRPALSSRLRLALDPAAMTLAGEDPEAVLEAVLAPGVDVPLGHLYLTDCRGGERVGPGEGELDWGSLSGTLLSGGFQGAVTVLLEAVDPLFAEIAAKEAAGFAHALFPDAIFAPDGGR